MDTITILADALARASKLDILRLDIQYNNETESYTGSVILGYGRDLQDWLEYDIHDNGTIEICPYHDTK